MVGSQSLVKTSLRPPPPAAAVLTRNCLPTLICRQQIDGEIRSQIQPVTARKPSISDRWFLTNFTPLLTLATAPRQAYRRAHHRPTARRRRHRVDLGNEWGTELVAYGVLTQRRVTMLRPTKGSATPLRRPRSPTLHSKGERATAAPRERLAGLHD